MDYEKYAPIMKALADETRLKIVDMLSCGGLCACKILDRFSITQPTLSYHMKILTSCGLVKAQRDGAWMHYSIAEGFCEELMGFLTRLMNYKDDCICKEINEAGGCCGEEK